MPILSVLLPALALAQQRLPVPSPSEPGTTDTVLEVLAAAHPDVDGVLRLVADTKRTAAVRYALCDHAARCALAAGDLSSGLRVADVRAQTFALSPLQARVACLQQFEDKRAVAGQVLAGGWLAAAERELEGARDDLEGALRAAQRNASNDRPRGLQAYVAREVDNLVAARAVFERSVALPNDHALRGRYLTMYRGRWEAGLALLRQGDDRPARIGDSKLRAGAAANDLATADLERLAQCGEEWLSLSLREPDVIAQRHLRRRAMHLLAPALLAGDTVALGDGPASDPERKRLVAVLGRAEELAADTFPIGAGRFRFAQASDLGSVLIAQGTWQVLDGALVGHSDGVATRATTPFAWRTIEAVTICGGIRSPAALNFRVAVGDCNLLFNWEVADANHFYFGQDIVVTTPRRLRAQQEHRIVLRRVEGLIRIEVDGDMVAQHAGELSGAVSVYPAVGSTIFVTRIDVVGDLDLGAVVHGPVSTTR